MNSLNVFYQFDENYAPYAGTSMTSLLENNKDFDTVTIYVLGDAISEKNIKLFEKLEKKYNNSKIKFVAPDDLVVKMKEWNMPSYRNSYAANLRLFFDYLIEEDIERIIYLDSDTIVSRDLHDLVEYDLQGKTIGMVIDSLGRTHKRHIGFDEGDYYFNSGVILYNVKAWKERCYAQKIVEYVKNVRANFVSPDQDLINIVVRGDICPIPMKYNFQPVHKMLTEEEYLNIYGDRGYYSKEDIRESFNNVAINHTYRFLGVFPWHKDNLHPDNDLFDFYLNISPWSDYKKKEAKVGLVMKIEKILFRILPHAMFFYIFRAVFKIVNDKENNELKQK